MDNTWAILIGINQYQHLQPLLYAQPDAQSLRNFLVDEAGVTATQCLLLGDGSEPIADQPTLPTKAAIEGWLTHFCKTQVQPDDKLWLVFVGYGASWEGRDYLMPIDGDPNQLDETAIAIAHLYDILQTAPTPHRLVLLDMNYSAGRQTEAPIGKQALQLAEAYEIATILSCQPEQTAHDTVALRSGLFTSALLEGLRYQGCVTPGQIYTYLGDRLPELSQHHWRPEQTPAAAIPIEQRHAFIVPAALLGQSASGYEPLPGAADSNLLSPDGDRPTGVDPELDPETAAMIHLPHDEANADPEAAKRWDWLLRWGAIFGLIFLAAIMARTLIWPNPAPTPEVSQETEADTPPDEADTTAPADNAATTDGTANPDDSAEAASGEAATGAATDATTAIAPAGTNPATNPNNGNGNGNDNTATTGATGAATEPDGLANLGTPLPDPSTNANGSGADANTGGLAQLNPFNRGDRDGNRPNPATGADAADTEPVEPTVAIQNAQQALAANQPDAAKAWLERIPEAERPANYDAVASEVEAKRASMLAANRTTLDAAKIPIRPTQASSFNQAIETARRIQPGQPLYDEAQANIDRWSQVILDLANGRAAQGNLESAIAAASLVPDDRPEFRAQAEQDMQRWRQQLVDRSLLREAQALIRPNQAHTYQRGIIWLQRVQTPNTPEKARADQLINTWSQAMLNLARQRAAQGNFAAAIQTANLVPETTPAFAAAQADLQRWRSSL